MWPATSCLPPSGAPLVGPVPHPMYVVHSFALTLSLGFFLGFYKVSQTAARVVPCGKSSSKVSKGDTNAQ